MKTGLGLVLTAFLLQQAHAQTNSSQTSFDAKDPVATYGEKTDYKIFRKGKKIGTHSVTFQTDGSELKVAVKSDIVVTVLKVPVFRFNYSAHETWEGGELQSIIARVLEKGELRENSLTKEGAGYRLTNSSGESIAENVLHASNHWNPEVLQSKRIFNTLTGKVNTVSIESKGTEKIKATQSEITASRYVYTGELDAETWYDENGRWVKLRFKGEDGSAIEYIIDE